MKKKLFKSKLQMIIYIILSIICIGLFIIIGKMNFQDENDIEALKFSKIYNLVDDDNIYAFSNASDILNIINNKSGVILFGFPQNKYVNKYASILNKISKEYNIDKIYYYDFLKDREESNGTYQTIVKKLSVYVPLFDDGEQNITAPTIVIVKNGSVVAYFDINIKGNISPEIYYNENQVAIITEEIKTALSEYIK